MNFKPFKCVICDGNVILTTGYNRFQFYRLDAPDFLIPNNMLIPTCENCNERYLNIETLDILSPVLEKAYHDWLLNK